MRRRGGEQQINGLFLQDVYTPVSMLELVGGIRADYWRAYDGFRRDTPPPAGNTLPLGISEGVVSIGAPFLVHGGVRLQC
jgi:hypothetical protein